MMQKIRVPITALAACLIATMGALPAMASLIGDQVQIIEWYSTAGSQYGATDGPFVITAGGVNFNAPGLSDVDFVVTATQIKFTTDGTNYGSAPFNGFDVQDLNTGTTITGVTLDPTSAAFPTAQFTFGANDVSINLAASTPFATSGTVILDVTTGSDATTPVPEPATWTLMLAGFIGVAASRRLARETAQAAG
jgi:hypothetical protein